MMGIKDARRKISGKNRTSKTRHNPRTRGIAAKEISSVNGDNPYPGSNDDGMDKIGKERREGRKRGEKERNEGVSRKGGTTLSWFPSGGFIMASSYYRRIHGHDANLRQGTKTDLTSTRIYGMSVQIEQGKGGRGGGEKILEKEREISEDTNH